MLGFLQEKWISKEIFLLYSISRSESQDVYFYPLRLSLILNETYRFLIIARKCQFVDTIQWFSHPKSIFFLSLKKASREKLNWLIAPKKFFSFYCNGIMIPKMAQNVVSRCVRKKPTEIVFLLPVRTVSRNFKFRGGTSSHLMWFPVSNRSDQREKEDGSSPFSLCKPSLLTVVG